MSPLPFSIIDLLKGDRPWLVLGIGRDPRELANQLSSELGGRLDTPVCRLSPALSEYDLDRVMMSRSTKHRVFVIADIAAHSAAFVASVVRQCTSNHELLVIGADDYSIAKRFANKISVVVDESITVPTSVSDELLERTIDLLGASSVAVTAELAVRRGVPNEDVMRYILLPQLLLRDIRPSQHQGAREPESIPSSDRSGGSTEAESVFDELPFSFIADARKQIRTNNAASKGHGALSRKGSSSHEIDHSRIRSRRAGQFSLFHTILAAAPFQNARRSSRPSELAVILEPDDIRRYPFLQRSRKLTVVVIDSSGSMAASSRIRFAKGLVSDLLKHSYRDRSFVALVVARGDHATTASAPTRSVAHVLQALRILPTGGATPLVSSLAESLRVIDTMMRRYGEMESEVILVTDGKGNIGESSELRGLAAAFHRRKIRLSVVDLVRANPSAVRFAETLGARYTFYPRGETAAHFA